IQDKQITFNIDRDLLTKLHLSDGEIAAFIKKALDKDKLDVSTINRPITIALLDTSEHLFEDHLPNSFIGINKAILEIKDKDIRNILLQVGIAHEMRHEATKRADEEFEKGNLKKDISLLEGLIDEIKIDDTYTSKLSNADVVYLKALYKKFKVRVLISNLESIVSEESPFIIELRQKNPPLIIGKNFFPSALLNESQRQELLGAIEYSDLAQDPENQEAAKNAILLCNPMDAGLGSSVVREEYLKRIWQQIGRTGKAKLGAKGTDLYFDVVLKGFDKKGNEIEIPERLSITELKYLQAITTASNYGEVIIQELVNNESEPFIKKFFDTIFILDRIDERIPQNKKRTYKKIIEQIPNLEITEDFIIQASLPTIDLQTGLLTTERDAPGGHGQLGTMVLEKALNKELPQDKVLIQTIYNGDGPNNFVDASIVGWMARNDIPIVMISTTKTELDRKGGEIGVEYLKDGKVRTQMLERAQAIENGQEGWFYRIGLPGDKGDEGEAYKQYFNTNTALVNYSVLTPFLKELYAVIGKEKFAEIISPDLISNVKKQNGKEFTQLEGALGSALLNLNSFIQTTDNPKVNLLLKKYNLDRLLYIVNVDRTHRNEFFTPVKFAYDFWFYAYSDHFKVNTQTWKLENLRIGHLPAFEDMDEYYKDVQNCIDAFGRASTIDLNSLSIKGKVHLKDAILKGYVEIVSDYPFVFDLNSQRARSQLRLTKGQKLILENVSILVDKKGNIRIVEIIDNSVRFKSGVSLSNKEIKHKIVEERMKIKGLTEQEIQSVLRAVASVKQYLSKRNILLNPSLENLIKEGRLRAGPFEDFFALLGKDVLGLTPQKDVLYLDKSILNKPLQLELSLLYENLFLSGHSSERILNYEEDYIFSMFHSEGKYKLSELGDTIKSFIQEKSLQDKKDYLSELREYVGKDSTANEKAEEIINKINLFGKVSPSRLHPAKVSILEDFMKNEPAKYSDYISKTIKAIAEGKIAAECFFAGAAIRMGKGPLYNLDPWEVVEDEIKNGENLPENYNIPKDAIRKIGLGPRQLIELRIALEDLTEKYNQMVEKKQIKGSKKSVSDVLSNFPIVLHINSQIEQVVKKDLLEHDFYGFSPERIIIIVQPMLPGWYIDAQNNVRLDTRSECLPYNHGWARMQLNWQNQAYTLDSAGNKHCFKESVIKRLQSNDVHYMVLHRINDLDRLSPKGVLDINLIALSLYLMRERGFNLTVELVGNPKGTKGGLGLRIDDNEDMILIEGLNSKSKEMEDRLSELTTQVKEEGKTGLPYNAMRQVEDIDSTDKSMQKGLPLSMRIRGGNRLYPEIPVGDATQIDTVKAGAIMRLQDRFMPEKKNGEEIYDFKKPEHVSDAIRFLEKQDRQKKFRKLAEELGFLGFDAALKNLWDKRMEEGWFRYDAKDIERKRVGKFWAQFNPGRAEKEKEINWPGENTNPVWEKFGWTDDYNKISTKYPGQRLFNLKIEEKNVAVNINYAPILPYHFLLIPLPEQERPQFITPESLEIALKTLEMSKEPNLRFGFNSRGAWASINHLHFQGFYYPEQNLPLEEAKRVQIERVNDVEVSNIISYPIRGLVFKGEDRDNLVKAAFNYIQILQNKNIPHTLLIKRDSIYVLPRSRKRSEFFVGGIGFFEVSGEVYLGEKDRFDSVEEKDIFEALSLCGLDERKFKETVDELKDLSGTGINRPPLFKDKKLTKLQEITKHLHNSKNISQPVRNSVNEILTLLKAQPDLEISPDLLNKIADKHNINRASRDWSVLQEIIF
ncbi:MAG: UTP--glucose-1-phosphate uridylyltransferase, partial [Candidatus Omnitrophica bacterium]|nr:UTP--glucose-1-phosphate uridylyltransferase [Candidatus Omnitrophota bacterium]